MENRKEKTRQELVDSSEKLRMYEGLMQDLLPRLDPVAKSTVLERLGLMKSSDTIEAPSTDSIGEERLEADDSYGNFNEDSDSVSRSASGLLTTQRFLGGHSERTWVRDLNQSLLGSPPDVETFLDEANFDLDDIDPQIDASVDVYKLPLREEADALVDIFFAKVHPAVKILNKQLFMNDYERFWIGIPHKSDPHSIALLNAVFAISELFNCMNTRMQETHLVYARRAKQLVGDMLVMGDLVQVQNMALLGFYFLASNQMTRAYLYLGATARCAVTNGLHLPLLNAGFTRAQQVARTRAWLTICQLERASSLATGRPSAVSDEHCCHLEAEDVVDAAVHGNSWVKTTSLRASASVLLFNEQTKLLAIHARVVKEVYPSHLGAMSPSREDNIIKLVSLLNVWRAELPHELNIASIPRGDSNELQKVLLALSYNHVKNFVTRPILLGVEEPAASNICLSHECIGAAQHMTLFLFERSHDLHTLLHSSPWWSVLQFLMCAGLTLVAGSVHFASNSDQRTSLISDAERILNMFQLLETSGNLSARRCVKIMTDLVCVADPSREEFIRGQRVNWKDMLPFQQKTFEREPGQDLLQPSRMDGPHDYYMFDPNFLHIEPKVRASQKRFYDNPFDWRQGVRNQLSERVVDMLKEGVVDPQQL